MTRQRITYNVGGVGVGCGWWQPSCAVERKQASSARYYVTPRSAVKVRETAQMETQSEIVWIESVLNATGKK